MSDVESALFWPAVREAYVKAPNLASPTTWLEGLYDVASSLRYYRPRKTRRIESTMKILRVVLAVIVFLGGGLGRYLNTSQERLH